MRRFVESDYKPPGEQSIQLNRLSVKFPPLGSSLPLPRLYDSRQTESLECTSTV